MSNVAGKAYAMNLLTPIRRRWAWVNKLIFWVAGRSSFKSKLLGLETLSMIHYARWTIVKDTDFPHLAAGQPREELGYAYMLFCSNFNGSWGQYVDSFSVAISGGLNLLWKFNIGWPGAVPETPFHRYVQHNELRSNHYYSAYPMAASNDIKAAARIMDRLERMIGESEGVSPELFQSQYNTMLRDIQGDLGLMAPTPTVSVATKAAIAHRLEEQTHG